MNAYPDLDRLLDAWLDDGPLVLPDRVFDVALEIAERTPQHGERHAFWRYLLMIGSTSQRSIAPVAVLGAVAAIVVVTATAIALLQPRLGGPTPGVAPPIVLTLDDIKAVVLQPDEAPPGTEYSESLSGPVNLGLMAGYDTDLLARWSELRLGDTWHSLFRGSDRQWGTAALLWPDSETAHQAYAAHVEALPGQLTGERSIAAEGIGEEASCYSFASNAAFRDSGALCLFRVGNATFFVPGSGDGVEAASVLQVARLIAARAAAIE